MNKLRQVISLVCVSAVFSLLAINASIAGGDSMSGSDLSKLLHQASEDVQSAFPEIPGQLTLSSAFTAIWKNAHSYRNAARTLLASKDVPEREKLILAYAMQALCLKDLLELDKEALGYWKRGAISVSVLDTLVFPVYDWNTQLQQNYKNPEVKSLLLKIKEDGVYARNVVRSSYLEEVISGQASKDIERLRRDGQLEQRKSQLRCEN